jgi:periplasmic protein TonB
MAEEKSTAQYRDMLDIIFANRNKSYGAYELRRNYHKYLGRGLVFGLLFLTLLFLLPRILGLVSDALTALKPKVDVEVEMTTPDLETTPPPPPPPPPPTTPPPPVRASVQFTPPVQVEDTKEVLETPPPDEKDERSSGATTNTVQNEEIAPIEAEGIEAPPQVEVVVEKEKEYEAFEVNKMPSFPGGEAEMRKFLAENIKYPAIARENNIQGKVVLSFTVDKTGKITDIAVIRDIGGGCGKEAVRVVNEMPRWVPGEAAGNPVKVKFTLPVTFKLD